MLDKLGEPAGEDVARDAQLSLELFEMAKPIEGSTQNQERPALAYHFQRSWKAALQYLSLETFDVHESKNKAFRHRRKSLSK